MFNTIDPYWGSLQRVCTLKVPLTQLYKWTLVTEQGGGVCRGNLNG